MITLMKSTLLERERERAPKLKSWLAITSLMLFGLLSQAQTINLRDTINKYYSHLSHTQMVTDLLYDRAAPFSNYYRYNGTFDTSGTLNSWKQMYHEVQTGAWDTTLYPKLQNYLDTAFKYAHGDTIPVGVLALTYDRFKDSAFVDSLVYLDTITGYYEDNPNRIVSPYMVDTLLTVSQLRGNLDSGAYTLMVSIDNFVGNLKDSIATASIDVNDGNGWQTLDLSVRNYLPISIDGENLLVIRFLVGFKGDPSKTFDLKDIASSSRLVYGADVIIFLLLPMNHFQLTQMIKLKA